MANIAITNCCNLKCPYCFADNMIQNSKSFMTIDNYSYILSLMDGTKNRIGIIGGEPTLHPQFSEILTLTNQYCKNHDTFSVLFTNGIKLYNFLEDLGEIQVLINYNDPKIKTTEQNEEQNKTLHMIKELGWFQNQKVICGCNIHLGCNNYDYIWKLVDEYDLTILRCSIVCPEKNYNNWQNKKDEYYNTMKPIFLQFCKDAILHKCKLRIDCNHIPLCYFNSKELDIIYLAQERAISKFCYPTIDVTMDLKAVSCFGVYDPVDITPFDNFDEIYRYLFITQNLPRVQKNNTGKCKDCEKYKLYQCQGGCLAFSSPE